MALESRLSHESLRTLGTPTDQYMLECHAALAISYQPLHPFISQTYLPQPFPVAAHKNLDLTTEPAE